MKSEIYSYSTIKGKVHFEEKKKNQDAYIVKQYSFGTILVISDGMGSHPHSDVGSKAVCKAVSKAVGLWVNKKCKDIRLLIPLIHTIWNIEISPYERNECGATCLFAIILKDGKIYVGQLGDGDIYLYMDKQYILFKEKEDDFANITIGINNIRSFRDWHLGEYEIKQFPIRICMMTDGISETLIPEKKKVFVDFIGNKMRSCEQLVHRNHVIYEILRNWGEVNCGDDRTIIYYEIK